jgi:aspartyl-tRNA(Asn)/glutamyl-tRNA(Gln) amidotransferase subunit B
MEKGQMRVEVNISLSENDKLGTKVEIKNLNSFKAAEKAVDYEIRRQTEVLENKEKIIQETRGWDDVKAKTFSQREKEEAHDYRYFPEPDLPPVILDEEFINTIKAEIPELPAEKRKRFSKEYGLDAKSIEIFTDNKDLGEYFEKVISELKVYKKEANFVPLTKLAANYIITDLLGLMAGRFTEKECDITPENFAEFIALINDGKITSKTAKEILVEMLQSGEDPSQIIDDKGLGQVSDEKEIEKIVKEIVADNSEAVDDYKKGKQNALQFLAGQVMAKTRGRAKPETVQKLLKKILK